MVEEIIANVRFRPRAEVDAISENCATCRGARSTGTELLRIYLQDSENFFKAPCGSRAFLCVDYPGYVCEQVLFIGRLK